MTIKTIVPRALSSIDGTAYETAMLGTPPSSHEREADAGVADAGDQYVGTDETNLNALPDREA
jgi:hypothetical protein